MLAEMGVARSFIGGGSLMFLRPASRSSSSASWGGTISSCPLTRRGARFVSPLREIFTGRADDHRYLGGVSVRSAGEPYSSYTRRSRNLCEPPRPSVVNSTAESAEDRGGIMPEFAPG